MKCKKIFFSKKRRNNTRSFVIVWLVPTDGCLCGLLFEFAGCSGKKFCGFKFWCGEINIYIKSNNLHSVQDRHKQNPAKVSVSTDFHSGQQKKKQRPKIHIFFSCWKFELFGIVSLREIFCYKFKQWTARLCFFVLFLFSCLKILSCGRSKSNILTRSRVFDYSADSICNTLLIVN